ncbi:hypothetical protein Ddye_020553 [Dipteronia dyeriana]|uniref:SWIM-type domain-containing protein n=1 Tax=Dipteronia dyeriana TaxID=168575 RepID=A0AAD9U0E5_9ROSI|nr:hypothetical protein Ddye_020553 [Dipteronia dyeriana]
MCQIHPTDFNRFKVEDQWNEAIVDMEHSSCSCREWDLDDLSCIHAIAAATLKGMPINVLCSDFFTIGWMKQAYAMAVNPIPNPKAWDLSDDVLNRVVLPWKKKHFTGRPKKNHKLQFGRNESNKHVGIVGIRDTIKKVVQTHPVPQRIWQKNHIVIVCAIKKDITSLSARQHIKHSTPV